jgi:hemoglobin
MPKPTLFEALGGMDRVLRLARAWHERVMADDIVSHAFSHGFHPQHTERLAAYWGEAWGGPCTYTETCGTESSVVRMHSGNGEHAEMDRRAIQCFDMALQEVAVGDPELKRCLLSYFVWTTTNSMAAYPDSASDVPQGLQLPRWSWNGLLDPRA